MQGKWGGWALGVRGGRGKGQVCLGGGCCHQQAGCCGVTPSPLYKCFLCIAGQVVGQQPLSVIIVYSAYS